MIKALECETSYVTIGHDPSSSKDDVLYQTRKVRNDDIVLVIHFLIRRLTLDNRGPSHPATYDQTILQSDLFKTKFFGDIMGASLEAEEGSTVFPDRCARSKLKTAFISVLGAICSNDPAQIPKLIENGLLKQVTDTVKKGIPVHRRSMYILLDLVRMIVIHERGKEFVKNSGIFSTLMLPCTSPFPSDERTGEEKDSNNLAFVMLASN